VTSGHSSGLQAVFLDRDGTLNVKADEGDYITRPADLVLLPGAAYAVRRLNDAGVPVFVVTNQRGVARGLMSHDDLDAVHVRLADLLREVGASVRGTYTCVHGHGQCECRKPLPGLLHQAATEHGLDLAHCAMVGDAASDVAAGRAAGCYTVRIAGTDDPDADVTVPTLHDAVERLLSERSLSAL
jgi:D-glycero-D-manno-heptose 1,7-bisphosphate phosphatase